LFSVVLLGGVMAGVAFSFMLTQIDDSVMTVRELKDAVGVQVLGAISLVNNASRSQQHRASAVAFMAVCLALVVVYVGILSLQSLTGPHA
jgi:hypothetical protein